MVVKNRKYPETEKRAVRLLEQEERSNHNIVKRFADNSTESPLSVNETSMNFFCNNERLKAIMLAVSYLYYYSLLAVNYF